MLRAALGLMSPGGARGRLSVLIFHRVLERPDPLFPEAVDAARFDAICRWLRAWFNVLPLDEAVRRLRAGTLPPRAAGISFDDGYADNHDQALPILERRGLAATFFIASGFLDGGLMWNDVVIEALRRTRRGVLALDDLAAPDVPGSIELPDVRARRAAVDRLIAALKYRAPAERQALVERVAEAAEVDLPRDLMLTSAQVHELRRRGMQIGAHTLTHPILANLDFAAARREIEGSRAALEGLIGEPVTLFAYPNGRRGQDFGDAAVALARAAGFEAAFTTDWGVADRDTDAFALPRFTPWDLNRWRFGARLAMNLRRCP